tara:strand:+ start:44007 stop:47246 length:3240 start_codon:yes stop_codon:yes gene_type:complete
MPKREDIKSILIIGAGPIIIGQACEFDYSGTQACKALRDEGYRVILVNSNPATIMTDPEFADATYIEPITPEVVKKIIEVEKPNALLPTMGGQTALNTALSLADSGVLEENNVALIGASPKAIKVAEDRQLFREAMDEIGLDSPKSQIVRSMDEGWMAIEKIGLPAIIRPSFTLGGTGGGIAYNREEFESIVTGGIDASPANEVLVEESVLGWKEYEMEVVRDKADNCIIICSIENLDPMGIHTGDSITMAPALTLTDKEYQRLRNASINVLRKVGVETGGSNVQFAINPENGRLVIIEMNPRVSRSSALASKATGFPIAKVAAKLAIGYTLDEIQNDITGSTPASFEPTIDYVVTKVPRFTFEKFPDTQPLLTTSMKSVGEAMAIGRNFQESLQKALRSMETGLTGLDEVEITGWTEGKDKQAIIAALGQPRPDRVLIVAEAFRAGISIEKIHAACHYDKWFLEKIKELVEIEESLRTYGMPQNEADFSQIKSLGFGDDRIAYLTGTSVSEVVNHRIKHDVFPVFKRIDTCAAEFASGTPYMYSCYETGTLEEKPQCESEPTDKDKIIILGGGPNRIGQGIEFDYCCVHAAFALSEAGFETIMINCNPETVSTDYDTSDRLYFEPLTIETVLEIVRKESQNGNVIGVNVQFGGQTPLKLANSIANSGIPILGTNPDAIDLAEDRDRFRTLLQTLNLKQPDNATCTSTKEATKIAKKIGYPVVVRPSYVLGGRAMEIIYDEENLDRYMNEAVKVSGDSPVLIDSFLQDAIEVDVDALSDGDTVYVAGVMEHIEEAGIHSGDSACSLPPFSLDKKIISEICRQTEKLAKALNVKGLMNVQYAVKDRSVFIIEVNPRASRTVPFVAKSIGMPIARVASLIMAGKKLSEFTLASQPTEHIAVKEAVFPFARFPGIDLLLGPEMRSTGEVMGIDRDFGLAFAKAQLGAGMALPAEGKAFISVKDSDKTNIIPIARQLSDIGFKIMATNGTANALASAGLNVESVNKVYEGRPHCVDAIKNGDIQLVVNTVEGSQAIEDSYTLRRTALEYKLPYFTTLAASKAMGEALTALNKGDLGVRPLQSY